MRSIWIGITVVASFALAAPAVAGPPDDPSSSSNSPNAISGLEIQHESDGTYLRLKSARTPSFSVFKLKDPLRLVVDVSNSRLEEDGTLREVDNGVVSQVSLLENQKRDGTGVRLIVGFDRAAHYDVRTRDQDVVIFVEGESSKPRAEGEEAEQKRELAATKEDVEEAKSQAKRVEKRLSKARTRIERLRGRLKKAKDSGEKRRLRSKVESTEARAQRLENRLQRKSKRLESLEKKVSTLERRLSDQKSKARQRAKKLQKLREKRRKWNDRLKERNRKYEAARRKLDRKESEVETLRSELERLERKRDRARGEKRERLQAKLEKRESRLRKMKSQIERKRNRVEALQGDLEELRRERDRARERLAAMKKQWKERLRKSRSQYEKASKRLEATRERLEQAQNEIDALRKKKNESEGDEREELEAKLVEKTRALESVEQKLDRQKKRLRRLERQRDKAKSRVASVQKRWRRRLEKSRDKYEETSEQLTETKQRVEKAKTRLRSYKNRLSSRDKKIDRLEERIGELQNSRGASEERKQRLAALEQKLTRQKDEVEKLRRARTKLERELKSLRRTKRRARKRVKRREREVEKARNKLETYRKRLEERDRKISKLESRVDRLEAERRKAEQKKRSKRVRKLEQKLERKQRQLEELESTRARQKRRLAELRKRNADAGSGESKRRDSNKGAARAVPMTGDDAESGHGRANTIRDIRLETEEGRSRIVVELERPGAYKRLPRKNSRAVMLLKNVELPDRLEQTIAAGDSGAVRFVSSYAEDGGEVRMEAELDTKARERIHQEGDKLVWEFAPKVAEEAPDRRTASSDGKPRRPDQGTSYTGAPPDYPRTVTNPAKVNRVPGMSRKRLTIDLRGADIQNVLRLFAKEGGVNIIAGDNVSGSVTLRLKDVPLDEAFLIVLQSLGLGFEKRGSVIRVATQKKLLSEQEARRKARRQKQKTRPLEVFLMPVNYAKASELTDQVKRLLSPRGSVSVDSRTNTLIIKDLPENIRSIRKLVSELDSQVPQVLIEARIVETNDTFSQEFGIQWGGDFTASQGGGNPTGLLFPNVIGVAGGATDGQTPTQGSAANPNFAVNLPAPAGTGAGGALGLTLGSIAGVANLNLRLSAAEESGRAKIVSAPKILTLDNREATISQGTSIPISVVSAAGVQTVFVDATLELTVTPHVTPDGNVQMEISATKNEPDFQNTGARGDPTIIRKQAETELLIEDGETTVIGGIYTRNSGQSMTGIPVLHQIPILGQLFKSTSRSERRTELLIFITPRVVNRAEALDTGSAGNVVEGGLSGGGNGGGGGDAGGGGGGAGGQ